MKSVYIKRETKVTCKYVESNLINGAIYRQIHGKIIAYWMFYISRVEKNPYLVTFYQFEGEININKRVQI